MSQVGKREKETQERVIKLFTEELGYRYLGHWQDRERNSNVEEAFLTANLERRGYSKSQIDRALERLRREADFQGRNLYETNRAVYSLLRYGVPVKVEAGQVTDQVHLIDWQNIENNDFGIAEEVTLHGDNERRPDLVLYLNGLAIGVIELKSSVGDLGDGIRQLISNQKPMFNEWFFSTVQYVFAGNDSEGLQYGTTGTPQKFFLKWKEDEEIDEGYKLDKYLRRMCRPERLLELIYDFVLFDGGVKKVPRVHQYFGIKAAQESFARQEGGIIWHTQGSGKSIVMVLLAKWILENNPNARVAVITDRDELDKQIEGIFRAAGEEIHRSSSGQDLMKALGAAKPRLLCSLVHKFGRKDVDDFEAYLSELKAGPSKVKGELFVFVDECHRTQSGKLHRAMKAIMPNSVFVGFTGTPLLKSDKETTLEVFGSYIHTYKFNEAVEDEVILDLIYEARDVDQDLRSEGKVDTWFETKTQGLNEWQQRELKKKWGTMQKVLSSRSRMERIINEIIFDFETKSRLASERGTAMLVCRSIYEACKYFSLFQKTPLRKKCAVVTSYNPHSGDISREDTGEESETDREFVHETYTELLKEVEARPKKSKTETYEDEVKEMFIKSPTQMKLLIVVEKLLTGFDAPSCSYLYIDKSMQDHGLFQAVCRTNRLDDDDKDFGYIVDFRDLFKKFENVIAVYTSDLAQPEDGGDPEITLKERLAKGKEQLDATLEKLEILCDEIEEGADELEYIRYFCGNTENENDLAEREPRRAALYQSTAAFLRAYANLASDLGPAGYSDDDIEFLKERVRFYAKLRDTIKKASGEYLDFKLYEADMRHLLDAYVEASEPRKISSFDKTPLVDLIVNSGMADAIAESLGKNSANKDSVAETIENNVRKKIISEKARDPAFFGKMSVLLSGIIAERKKQAVSYEKYLEQIEKLIGTVVRGHSDDLPSQLRDSSAVRALYNVLFPRGVVAEGTDAEVLRTATEIDQIVREVKPDGFRETQAKRNVVKAALLPALGGDPKRVEEVFEIILEQSEYS